MATEVLMPTSAASAGGNRSWENTNNIYDTSPSTAKVVLNRSGHVADTLRGDFTSFVIDKSATITGLEVTVSRRQSGNFDVMDSKAAFLVGGVIVGQNKAKPDRWPSTLQPSIYGGENDLWGLQVGELFDEENTFKAFQFGYGAEPASGKSDPVELHIQYMQVTVHYSKGGFRFRQTGDFKPVQTHIRVNGSWMLSGDHFVFMNGAWRQISYS